MTKIFPYITLIVISIFAVYLLSDVYRGTGEQRQERRYPPSSYPDRIILTWSGDPSTTVSVTWRTDDSVKEAIGQITPVKGKPPIGSVNDITFSTEDTAWFDRDIETVIGSSRSFRLEGFSDHYHSVTFTGLEPNTQYAYRVGSQSGWSEWFHVTTASSGVLPFSFIYFGDAQNDIRSYWSRTIRAAYSMAPHARFMLHAGDLVLSSGNDDTWGEWFEAGSWILASVPSIPTAGNSDHVRLRENGIDRRMLFPQWHLNFTLPQNGPQGLENVTYYIDYQDMRIISLYSNYESAGEDREIFINTSQKMTTELFDAQTTWLEEVLRNNTQRWTVVVFHHPVFTGRKDRYNERIHDAWVPLFEKYSVDLVLQGHDHLYARGRNPTSKNGPTYVISVGGPKMRSLYSGHEWIEVSAENLQMFQIISVDGDTLTYRAYTVAGQLVDSFMIINGGNGKRTFDGGKVYTSTVTNKSR